MGDEVSSLRHDLKIVSASDQAYRISQQSIGDAAEVIVGTERCVKSVIL